METPIWIVLTLALVMTTAPATAGLTPNGEDLDSSQMSTPAKDVCTSGALDGVVATCEKWVARYDGGGTGPLAELDRAKEVVVSPDGERVFVYGRSYDGQVTLLTNGDDITVVAYDAETGEELWVHREDGAVGGSDFLAVRESLTVSPDSSTMFFASTLFNGVSSYYDMTITALDTDSGEVSWRATYYTGQAPTRDYSITTALSPDGGKVALTGIVDQGKYALTVMYDAEDGEELWASRHGNVSSVPADLAFHPDGDRVLMTGALYTDNRNADFHTLAFNATTGDTLWVSTYDGNNGRDVPSGGMDVTADLVLVAGTSDTPFDEEDAVAVAYDAETGEEVWTAHHDDRGAPDHAVASQASPDGSRFFVLSYTPITTWHRAYSIVAFDTLGEKQWESTWDYDDPRLHDLEVGPAGERVYVAGFSEPGPYGSILTYSYSIVISYDAGDGEATWGAAYKALPGSDGKGPAHKTENAARNLAVSPDGSTVFLAGDTATASCCWMEDYLTVAFDTVAHFDTRVP